MQDCNKKYIGETGKELKHRIQEHKQALRRDDDLNSLVQHRNLLNHQIDINNATTIHKEDDLTRRKLIEAAIISEYNTFDQRPGFINIAPTLSKKILKTYKIQNIRPPE